MRRQFRMLAVTSLFAFGSLYTATAHAGALAVLLVRSSLNNVTDTNGSDLWQYEGGVVENAASGAVIGHYLTNRRVTAAGTSTDNTAAMSTTLFFSNTTAGNAPFNITIQGAWSYTSGQFLGSVSAASSRYHEMIGSDAFSVLSGSLTSKLEIDWPGQQTLP